MRRIYLEKIKIVGGGKLFINSLAQRAFQNT